MKTQLRVLVRFVFLALLLLGDIVPAGAARVGLTVAPYFTSHMVLQRDTPVPVWGTAGAGVVVTVSFAGKSFSSPTVNGKWMVRMDALGASTTPRTLVISDGRSSLTLTDVLVGEVWVLSGQSNINVRLNDCDGGPEAVRTSTDYPDIRLYLIPQTGPLTETWEPSNPTNTPDWSGVGFFFARALTEQLPVPLPIGLIQVAKNGTPIADWTKYGGSNNGRLYRDKIVPLQPFAIRGVLWYQGEDDGSRESTALQYYDMLPGLIANWRADWGQGAFPFYYVQLAPIAGRPTWAILRDAQVSTLDRTENTAMACIIDVPTIPTSDIHPKDKEPVGQRLALPALALLYGQAVDYAGPIRNVSQSVIGNPTIVTFDHIDQGLVTDDGLAPGPFMLAGTDGVYYPATATLSSARDAVVVSSPSVPNPVAVRYCWGSYPACNLFNDNDNDPSTGYGLPASPFQLPPP
jgi:sialate O-acetylesterase